MDASLLISRESAGPRMKRVIGASILVLPSIALHVSGLGVAREGQIVCYVKVDIQRLNVDLHFVTQGTSSHRLITQIV